MAFDQPVALSRMRRAVVRTVTASMTVPQYALAVDVPFASVLTARDAARVLAPRASVTDVVHRAAAVTLAAHRNVNASFTEEGIVQHAEVNLAFVVETTDGMLTPAIRNADERDITALVAERLRLSEAALAGALTPQEMLSGTFTVSNLGPFGVHRFTAMVLPPQAAILAVGAPTPEGALTLTLSCDHRVVDGAPAARFLREMADRLMEERS